MALLPWTALILLLCPGARAEDEAALFTAKCAGCHSIGGGNLVGPDLAPSAKWSVADLTRAIKGMEKNVGPLKDDEVTALVAYLKKSNASKQTAQAAPVPGEKPIIPSQSQAQPGPVIEPASAERGRSLFTGAEALKNGGLSCIACHRVDNAGGTMGPELTALSKKISGDALISACEHTPYKVMNVAYKSHPVLHQEALDLAAYFTSLKEPHQKIKEPAVAALGAALAATVLGIIAFGYRNRNTSARAKLKRRD